MSYVPRPRVQSTYRPKRSRGFGLPQQKGEGVPSMPLEFSAEPYSTFSGWGGEFNLNFFFQNYLGNIRAAVLYLTICRHNIVLVRCGHRTGIRGCTHRISRQGKHNGSVEELSGAGNHHCTSWITTTSEGNTSGIFVLH